MSEFAESRKRLRTAFKQLTDEYRLALILWLIAWQLWLAPKDTEEGQEVVFWIMAYCKGRTIEPIFDAECAKNAPVESP
jgi:uncharacterized membrane protein